MSEAGYADYDVQGVLGLQGEIAHGWCHSPQLPAKALRVEILADGAVVAAGVAARLQLELVRPGISDGYHGFALPLPQGAREGVMLEARESATGQVFARRLPTRATDMEGWQRDLAILGRGLSAMHAMLGRQKPAQNGLATALRTAGRLYAPEPAGAKTLALREVADPEISLILDLPASMPRGVSDVAAGAWALEAVARVAPLLARVRAELIAIDDGRAAAALTRVRGLKYCRSEGTEAEARVRAAGEMVLGKRVVCLDNLPNTSFAERLALLQADDIET